MARITKRRAVVGAAASLLLAGGIGTAIATSASAAPAVSHAAPAVTAPDVPTPGDTADAATSAADAPEAGDTSDASTTSQPDTDNVQSGSQSGPDVQSGDQAGPDANGQ